MNLWVKLLVIGFILFLLYEVILTYSRFIRRKQIYQVAVEKSKETGKPLLVIGDPDNGTTNFLFGRCYGCGDTCLDINGCPGCSNGKQSSMENYLPTLDSDSCVIFISCVLEYVDSDQIDFIISEIQRVSGNDYYIVSVDPYSITGLLYPTKFLTKESGPNQIIFTEYPEKEIKYLRL